MATKMYVYCKSCHQTVEFDEPEYRSQLVVKGEIKCPKCGNVVNRRRGLRNGFSREPISEFIKIDDAIIETKMGNHALSSRQKRFDNDYGIDLSDIEESATVD